MDDYADIYYVDARNADGRDHRAQGSSPWTPGRTQPIRPVQTVYAPGSQPRVPAPIQYGPPAYAQPPYAQPPYAQPPFYGQPLIYTGPQPFPSRLFGNMTTGQVVGLVAEIFAVLMPLPAAPVATRNPVTDVANGTLYNQAVAQHAKRDEQVRTLGSLVSRLVG